MNKQFYEQKKYRKHNRDINKIYLNCINELIGRHDILLTNIEIQWREDINDYGVVIEFFELEIRDDKYDFNIWVGKDFTRIGGNFAVVITDNDDNVFIDTKLEDNQEVIYYIRNIINQFGELK